MSAARCHHASNLNDVDHLQKATHTSQDPKKPMEVIYQELKELWDWPKLRTNNTTEQTSNTCLAPTFQRKARTAAASPLPSEAHPKRLSWRRSPRIQKGVWET